MNKATKIFFGTLFTAVALAVGNVIARQPSVSEEPVSAPLDPFSQRKVTAQPQSHGDLLVTTVQPGSALSAASSGFIPLERAAYRLSYNPATRLPVWVAWHLTAEHTDGPYSRKGIKFAEDEDVPVPRATNMDYINSGYDRGHICPSGDNKWSEEAQLQSFLYTNCCPQLHNLNAGDWNELEGKCRKWAQQYGGVYIVSGPLLLNKKHKTIGKNKPSASYTATRPTTRRCRRMSTPLTTWSASRGSTSSPPFPTKWSVRWKPRQTLQTGNNAPRLVRFVVKFTISAILCIADRMVLVIRVLRYSKIIPFRLRCNSIDITS